MLTTLLVCFALLCTCVLAVLESPFDETYWGPFVAPAVEEDDPACFGSFLSCKQQCSDLGLKIKYYQSPQNVEVFETYWYAVLGCLALATVVSVCWARRTVAVLQQTREHFAAREAALLSRCQGIQAQAFDLGERLQLRLSPEPGQHDASPVAVASLQATVGQPHYLPPAQLGTMTSPASIAPQERTPQSWASTPPGPPSDNSAPDLALLLVEAPPYTDTISCSTDQHTGTFAAVQCPPGSSAHKASPAKPAASSASQGSEHMCHDGSFGPYTPGSLALQTQAYPGSVPPMIACTGIGTPAAGMMSPSAHAVSSPPATWPQQHHRCTQLQGSPGSGLPCAVPGGSGDINPQGQQPSQADGTMLQQQVQQLAQENSSLKAEVMQLRQHINSPASCGWVTLNRGTSTPVAFNNSDSWGTQQQQECTPLPSGSPLAEALNTPATGSTTRSAGSLTNVHSVHSIAGSCGGSAPAYNRTAGFSPLSAPSSAASGAGGRAGQESPGQVNAGRGVSMLQLLNYLDDLSAVSAARAKKAQEVQAATERRYSTPKSADNKPVDTTIRTSCV